MIHLLKLSATLLYRFLCDRQPRGRDGVFRSFVRNVETLWNLDDINTLDWQFSESTPTLSLICL